MPEKVAFDPDAASADPMVGLCMESQHLLVVYLLGFAVPGFLQTENMHAGFKKLLLHEIAPSVESLAVVCGDPKMGGHEL